MAKEDEDILKDLIAGGIIGAALGALLSNNKNGASIGAVAGAAILASYKANEKAQKSNVPVLVKEGENIYEINSKGEKKFIKKVSKPKRQPPENFNLR